MPTKGFIDLLWQTYSSTSHDPKLTFCRAVLIELSGPWIIPLFLLTAPLASFITSCVFGVRYRRSRFRTWIAIPAGITIGIVMAILALIFNVLTGFLHFGGSLNATDEEKKTLDVAIAIIFIIGVAGPLITWRLTRKLLRQRR